MQSIKRLISPILSLFALSLLTATSYAATINLHQEPLDQSKITGTIDLSAGIIPIYTPKDSQWIKVADPRNGNTGWIKNSELKDSNGNTISFSQKFIDTGNGKQSVQMIQYGNKPISPVEQKVLEQQIQDQAKAAQESIVKMQQNMDQLMENSKKLYQQQMEIMKSAGFPVFMPGFNTPVSGSATTLPSVPQKAAVKPSATNTMGGKPVPGVSKAITSN